MKHIYDNIPPEDRFADRLREVAQNYEPPFEVADWAAMQQKLAQHNQKTVYKRLVAWVGASAAAAAAVLLVGYHTINTYLPAQNNQLAQENTKTKSNSLEEINSTSYSIEKEAITQNSTTANTDVNSGIEVLVQQEKASTTLTNTQNNLPYSTPVTNFDPKVATLKEKVFEGVGQEVKNLLPSTTITSENLVLESKITEIETLGAIAQTNIPSLTVLDIAQPTTELQEVERITAVASAEGKWRIGTALKAMVNFYKSDNQLRGNYDNGYGLLVDRQLGNSFNISAGAIYSEKHILIKELPQIPNLAALDDNEAVWMQKNTTQVNWKLIDLPLNMRYNAIQTLRNKWFVSTGISNYFFLKENYESAYTVSTPDIFDPRVTRTQSVTQQRETEAVVQPLATLNVSFGLETSLGKHLTLQVEPYWNFPIRSLGSEGVFVQTGGLLTRINFAR